MKKIGEFIYPWGNGHYSRMMRLNDALNEIMGDQLETHFFSKSEILEKLIKKYGATLKKYSDSKSINGDT